MRYPAYSERQPIDAAPLSRLPAHWRWRRLRFLTERIEQGWSPQCDNLPADEEAWGVMKVGCVNGHVLDASENKALPPDLTPLPEYELQPGDVLVSRANTRELVGSAALVPQGVRPRLLLCDKLFRLRPVPGIRPEFLVYLLRTPAARFHYERDATGASGSMQNIGQDTLKDLVVPLPPADEQERIANFLDWKTGQIDALIAKKTLLLARLREERATIITRAVTAGVGRRVPMRATGSPWLPEVPAHWRFMRFGYRTFIAEGQVDPESAPYCDLPLIAPNHIQSGTGRLLEVSTAQEQGAISGKYLVAIGDLIYSKIRPHLNKCVLVDFDALCSADAYPIRPEADLLPAYLKYWMLSRPFLDFATESSMRVAMPKINRDTLNAGPLPVPPMQEQRSIVTHIERHVARIDGLLAKVESALHRLTEYRSALITAATTGQIDVRGVAVPAAA